ncbi:hypothetical protein FRC00_005085 [Tulasnella sp. 408]|nr:hypothetical protein FRC00_005085 [Tulasnella sp. 408]
MLQGFYDWLKGTQPGGRPESEERGSTPRRLYPTLPEPSSPKSLAGNPQFPGVETLLPELSKLSISHSRTKNVPPTPIRSSVSPTSPPRLQALAFELPPSPFSNITGGNPNANTPTSHTKGPSNAQTPPKRRVPRSSKTPTKTKPTSPGPPGLPNSTPPAPPSTIGLVNEESKPPVELDELVAKLNSEKVKGFPDEEKLLKHQVEARIFLAKSEYSEIRGGQLHDMGLGKTVQIIARILDSKLLQKEVGSTL